MDGDVNVIAIEYTRREFSESHEEPSRNLSLSLSRESSRLTVCQGPVNFGTTRLPVRKKF